MSGVQDIPSLPPCPYGKGGKHAIASITPEDATLDMTLYCDLCGAVRRIPATGPLISESLDGLDVDALDALTSMRHRDGGGA